MKKSTVILIVVVIVGLIAVYAIQQMNRRHQLAPPEELFVKILPGDMRAADIHKVEIYRGQKKKEAVVLERKGDGWTVASKFNSKGNGKNITELLDDVKKLTGEVRTKKASLHKDFEITDDKAVHIAMYDKKGKLYDDLLLGKRGDRYNEGFVRLAKHNEVYLADKNLLSNLGIYSEDDEPDAKKWLDLKIIDEDKEKLKKIALQMPGKEVVLEKREKEKEEEAEEGETPGVPEAEKEQEKKEYEWVLTKPETEFKVKDSGITSLLSSISSFSGEDVADPTKIDEYGFDPASHTATVTLDDDTVKILLVGKKTETDNKRYARLKDEDTVYILPDYKITGVFKKMRDLLEIEVWDLKKEDVASIDLQKPEYEILLERRLKEGREGKEDSDYEWVLVKPEIRFKLQEYQVNNIVSKLIKPTPDDLFLTEELETYGLGSRSEFKAVMAMKDDSVRRIDFGKRVEGGSDDRYVKFEGIPYVYSYTKYNFESAFPSLTKLVNIDLLEDLDRDDIVSLKYDTPDEDFVLNLKEGTGTTTKKWSVKVAEEEFDAKKSVVDDILRDVTDIRGYDLVDIVMQKSDADCGLDEPSETLAISTDEAAEKYTFLVGKKVSEDSEDRYFKIKQHEEIFIISERAFNDIFKKLEDIKVPKPAQPKEEEKKETPATEKMKTPSTKKPPLPTEVKKAPSEQKPPAEEEKTEKPAEEKSPEGTAEEKKPGPGEVKKEEKPKPSTPPEELEKEDEKPAATHGRPDSRTGLTGFRESS